MCWQERNGVHRGGCGVNGIHEGNNNREHLFMYMFMHVYDGGGTGKMDKVRIGFKELRL